MPFCGDAKEKLHINFQCHKQLCEQSFLTNVHQFRGVNSGPSIHSVHTENSSSVPLGSKGGVPRRVARRVSSVRPGSASWLRKSESANHAPWNFTLRIRTYMHTTKVKFRYIER